MQVTDFPDDIEFFKTAKRIYYLRIAVVGAYLCGIIGSYRLWFGFGREFPRAPVFGRIPTFLFTLESFLSLLLVIALVLAAKASRPRPFLLTAVALTIFLIALDQTRLQPWVYQYILMLAVLAVQDSSGTEPVLSVSQLIIVFLYFWSGAQKLNWSFQHEVLPSLVTLIGLHLPEAWQSVAGIAVALCESFIGIALWIRRIRQIAIKLAILMHVLLLIVLVASGHNSVVWPWNVAMIAMVLLLFWRNDSTLTPSVFETRAAKNIAIAIVILCAVMPAFSFLKLWDRYLSAALYSGTAPIAVLHISESVRQTLPRVAAQRVFVSGNGELMLPLYEWSMGDLNIPVYPEARIYKQIASKMCEQAATPTDVELIIKGRPGIMDGSYAVSRLFCSELK